MPRAKTALVTGALGFVGRHIGDKLGEHDYHIDRWDIRAERDCLDLFREGDTSYDLVVHTAASSPNRKSIDTEPGHFPYNVMLDAAMFSWALRVRPAKVVYLSSSAVYRPTGKQVPYSEWHCELNTAMFPSDVYGWTKLNGEQMAKHARDAGLDVLVVRPFSGYGEDQSVDFPFGAIVERARRREDPITVWGDGNQVRDWIHIDDICNAIMSLLTIKVSGPINLCTGDGTAIGDLALLAAEVVGYDPDVVPLGGPHAGVDYRVGDPSLLRLQYTPQISLIEGIERRLGMETAP